MSRSSTINVTSESIEYVTAPKALKSEAEIMASWDNKNEIVVSICCLTFNHAKFIEDAINGFLIQETNFAFEVLIHDDASTDNTAQIIKKYVEQYPNIIHPIYQSQNTYSKGYGTFLFNALRVRGKYTALCEGDDFWFDKSKLQTQVDFLEENPEVVMCGHDVIRIDAKNKVILDSELRLSKNKRYSQNKIAMGFNLPSKSAVWRSDLPCLGPKMPFSDTFLFGYYGNFGKAYNFKKAMAAYRIHDGGIWSGISEDRQLVQSYEVRKSLACYSIPRYKSIAQFSLLLFLLEHKERLNITKSEIKTTKASIVKHINLSSFLYLFNYSTSKFLRTLKRKVVSKKIG
ncbi:glycosyltransferase [Psychrobacter sp. AH5]|uniref:glycosyltransferase n=1 Tax=Psychrobacter sp. AH5 TaxID=2937433 RepID=UPI003340CDC1